MSGYKVVNDDLLNLYDNSQFLVYHWSDILNELTIKIQCIRNIDQFQGEMAQAAKQYMLDVHVFRLLPALNLMLQQYQSMLVQYIHAFSNVDDYEHFYLDENVIEEAKDDFKQIWDCINDVDDQLSEVIDNVNDLFDYDLSSPDTDDMTSAHARLNYRLGRIESQIEMIENQEYRNRLNPMQESVDAISRMIDELFANSVNSDNTDSIQPISFSHPDLKALDIEINQMLQYEKIHQMQIQESSDAVGKQSTLRFEQRMQEEKASEDIIIGCLGVTIGAACIVLTMGAATPLVLTVGLTTAGTTSCVYGLSRELDSEQRYAKIIDGDTNLDTINIIRDGLFGGNEELYNAVGMTSIGISGAGVLLLAGGEFSGIAGKDLAGAFTKTLVKYSLGTSLYTVNEKLIDQVGNYFNLSDDEKIAISFIATTVEGISFHKLWGNIEKINVKDSTSKVNINLEGGSETNKYCLSGEDHFQAFKEMYGEDNVEWVTRDSLSSADRLRIQNWEYKPSDELYIKYKSVYQNDLYFDQATGETLYPADAGFLSGEYKFETIHANTVIDRIGGDGKYFSPEGTSYGNRALPPYMSNQEPIKYKVLRDFYVKSGTVAPWFDEPGGGIQYFTDDLMILSDNGEYVQATLKNLIKYKYIMIME